MGVSWCCRCLALCLALHLGWLLAAVGGAVGGASRCDSVFRGFSDCLLQLGDNMRSNPEHLDEREKLLHVCSSWDSFHACASTALADCQEGALELWEQLKDESRSLSLGGSLFHLCGGGSSAPRLSAALLISLLPVLLTALAL